MSFLLSRADFFDRLHPVWRLLLALLAGAALPLAFAPYGWWWVAFLSPALLFALLWGQSVWRAFWLGEAYGVGLWAVGAFWLYTSIHIYGDTPAPLALGMIAVVALVMGLFNAVSCALHQRSAAGSPLAFAGWWVLAEWCKTWMFTGFPWLLVGYGMTGRWLDGYAPVGGVLLVSLVVVLVAAASVTLLQQRQWRWAVPVAGLLGLGLALAPIEWTQKKPAPPLSVSLVQGNIPQDLKWLTEYRQRTLDIYAGLSESEWGRDLVVWPESSIPVFQTDVPDFLHDMAATARLFGSAWVTGIPWQALDEYQDGVDDYPPFYNAIMAAGDDGHGLYKKQRLVPFGEYIPLEGALKWVLPNLKRNMQVSSFSAGASNQAPLEVKGHRLAAAICYEVAYPNLTRRNALGSDFLVTLSNDAWFGTSDGPLQHLQMVQMRARETGRWFIRATNTGVTAFIDERGRLVRVLPRFKPGVLRGELPAMTGITPYMRWGDVPVLALTVLLVGVPGLHRLRKRGKNSAQPLP